MVSNTNSDQNDSWVDEDILLNNNYKKQPGIFWVTELADPCLRSVYFDRKIGKQSSINLLRIFNAGNTIEKYWIELLKRRKDIFILGTNVSCRHINPFYKVHGRADVLLQKEYGNIEVHEIKTIKCFGKFLEEPKPEHINQLQFYLNVLGVETGYIDYINKQAFLQGGDIIDRRFLIQRDRKIYRMLLRRAHELFGCLMADITPKKEKCWKCEGYCSYNEECEQV